MLSNRNLKMIIDDLVLAQQNDGKLDLDNFDRSKLAKLALTVIEEKIEEIGEQQFVCIRVEEASLCELLLTRPFIEIFLMSLLSVLIGLFIIGSSKAYGQATINNE